MVAPSTQALLTEWRWEPSVLIGIALFTAAYLYLVGPVREKYHLGPAVTRAQVTYFVLSTAVLIVALLSPLDYIGDRYLFSAHMVQHLLLAAVWPPLLLLATPSWVARAIFQLPGHSIAAFLVYPAFAILLFNVDIYIWHLPILYDQTLSSEGIHILEHLTFMALGVLNWWPVLSPEPSQRLSYPLQVLYLVLDGMLMMIPGIVFTFAPSSFYPPYEAAPRLWGLSSGADQQFGGLIMWYPGDLPYAVLLVVAFYRWFDEDTPQPIEATRISPPSPTIGPPGV